MIILIDDKKIWIEKSYGELHKTAWIMLKISFDPERGYAFLDINA